MRLKLLERFLKVKIITCHNNKSNLNQEDFLSLNQELRSLALQEFGEVPEYQCFLKNYDSIKDKIIVTHRNSKGELDGFSSSIIVKTENNGINEFMHLGIFIVSSSARHKNIQFKLGLGSTAGYLFSSPLRKRYWITNLSSVLGTLSIVDKMYLGIYPGLKKSKPDNEHLLIAKRFQDDVTERCFIAPDSMFDSNNFVYKKANANNCFKKSANDKKYHSLNGKHNQFYSQLGDLDSGDAILQVGYFNHFWFLLGMIAYTYRIVFRNPLLRLKDRRKSYV